MLDLPVIDLSDRHGGPTARRALARQLDAACRALGFFVVTDHGVDPRLRTTAFDAARAFFDMSLAAKPACEHPWPNVSRGYRRLGGEAQAYANDGDTPADLSETFGVGVEPIPDDAYHRDGAAFFPPVWPTGAAGMRAALLLLSRWTNGRWRSAWHRVVVPVGPDRHAARLSIVSFQVPNWDVQVEAVPSCLTPGQPGPEAVLAGEFLHAKFARLYSVAD